MLEDTEYINLSTMPAESEDVHLSTWFPGSFDLFCFGRSHGHCKNYPVYILLILSILFIHHPLSYPSIYPSIFPSFYLSVCTLHLSVYASIHTKRNKNIGTYMCLTGGTNIPAMGQHGESPPAPQLRW